MPTTPGYLGALIESQIKLASRHRNVRPGASARARECSGRGAGRFSMRGHPRDPAGIPRPHSRSRRRRFVAKPDCPGASPRLKRSRVSILFETTNARHTIKSAFTISQASSHFMRHPLLRVLGGARFGALLCACIAKTVHRISKESGTKKPPLGVDQQRRLYALHPRGIPTAIDLILIAGG